MQLQYDISVVNEARVKRVLRGIEQEAIASNRRVSRAMLRDTSTTAKGRPVLGQKPVDALKGFGEIGRAARAADMRASREAIANVKRVEAAKLRSIERVAAAEQRQITRAATLAQRESDRAASRAKREADKLERARSRTARGIVGGAARTVGGVARAGLALGGMLGGVGVFGAIDDQIDVQARASRLANQAGTPGAKGKLASEARGVRGFSGGEALEGLEQFTTITGDLEAARAILKDFGDLALATGTDLGEMMAAAGNAFVPLKDQIADPTERLKRLKLVMQGVAGMGNVGAVEIRDMASEMAGLAAQAGKFEGGADKVIQTSVAMAQAARQRGGAKSAAEAVTSVERFGDDLIQNSGKFEKMGVKVFADKGKTKMRDQESILIDVLKKTGGDRTKINKGFGVYAERAVSGFSPLYTAAEKAKKGSGEAAVRAEFERFRKAGMTDDSIRQNVESRMQDPDVQLKENLKKFNEAIGTQLVPELTKLIPKMAELTPMVAKGAKAFADLVSWATENPFKALGAIVAAAIAKEIAGAALGSVVSSALAKAMGGASSMSPDGKLGGATAAAAVGVSAAIYEADQFSKENKGVSLSDTIGGGILSFLDGQGFRGAFDVADSQANELARKRREEEDKRDVRVQVAGAAPATPPGAKPATAPAAQQGGGKDNAAAKLEGAADKIGAAADKLAGANGPRSGAPIVAR